MASINTGSNAASIDGNGSANYKAPLALMVFLFFMIGFITVLNDVLIPSLKGLFDLKPWQAMLIQFCFFGAYGIMSMPAGALIQKVGYKKGLAISLGIKGLGLLLFIPASMMVSYGFFLFALFVVASGLAILQVAINPYLVALGPEETGAARLNLGGALNSTATFVGPIIGGAFILKEGLTNAVEKAEAVRGPYIILAMVTIAIAAMLYFFKLPKLKIEVSKEEKLTGSAWQFKHLIAGAGAIFFYVGAEVAIGSVLILYIVDGNLLKAGAGIVESLGEEKLASSLLAFYWGGAMVGRFIGSALGQKIKANVMLRFVTFVAILLVGLSMTGMFNDSFAQFPIMVLEPGTSHLINFVNVQIPVSVLLLVLVGLFNSVMWTTIFPLSLVGLGKYTSQGSGILVTMVVGGAIIPLLQGYLAGVVGYQTSFAIVLVSYLYIFYFAVKGHKTNSIASSVGNEETIPAQPLA